MLSYYREEKAVDYCLFLLGRYAPERIYFMNTKIDEKTGLIFEITEKEEDITKFVKRMESFGEMLQEESEVKYEGARR